MHITYCQNHFRHTTINFPHHSCSTVNVSSRMESSSKAMMVQVGVPTAELLRDCDEFQLEPRGAVDVKGKGRMLTYWLWRARDCTKVAISMGVAGGHAAATVDSLINGGGDSHISSGGPGGGGGGEKRLASGVHRRRGSGGGSGGLGGYGGGGGEAGQLLSAMSAYGDVLNGSEDLSGPLAHYYNHDNSYNNNSTYHNHSHKELNEAHQQQQQQQQQAEIMKESDKEVDVQVQVEEKLLTERPPQGFSEQQEGTVPATQGQDRAGG
ncbi:hypothetical protein Vretimale_6636 [Volvox reticuliferus]|uniref:Guanylate cyclase domain-containing protein n=1 Tax=Volvox reticuliferus TaxID=1737510 RepID=A0A8J4G8E2_9CHLO|nr:hypothetical protein Vretimale_6636 [Volvox reticuliferus]